MTDVQHPDELLAWYVNGSLARDESQKVEAHLSTCARCRDEIAWLKGLRAQVRASGEAAGPGEVARQRLMRDIRRSDRPRRVAWWPALAVAATIVVAVQAALIVALWRPEPIVSLGAAPSSAVVVQLRFVPAATETQIRAVLGEVRGRIIDRPGAHGIYRVQLEELDRNQRDQIDRRVGRLRGQSAVIDFVALD